MKKLDNLLFTASCDFVPVRKVLVSIQTISLQTWYVICLTYVCPLCSVCVLLPVVPVFVCVCMEVPVSASSRVRPPLFLRAPGIPQRHPQSWLLYSLLGTSFLPREDCSWRHARCTKGSRTLSSCCLYRYLVVCVR